MTIIIFHDRFQGIPIGGYNALINKLLENIEVYIGIDFITNRLELSGKAKRILYTGSIDEYFNYEYGSLDYRSLKFEHARHEIDNYQGSAVVNFSDYNIPYTRIIEHKHFEFGKQPFTVVTKEYPDPWSIGKDAFYPINNNNNNNNS